MTTITRETLSGSWHAWLHKDAPRVGPYWLQLLWTLLLCMALAAGFTVFGFAAYGSGAGAWRNLAGWLQWYGINLVITLLVGFTIHVLFEAGAALLGQRRLGRAQMPLRVAYYTGIPVLGLAIGWPVSSAVLGRFGVRMLVFRDANSIAGSLLVSLLISSVLYIFFDAKRRQSEAERRATESQLRLLQGQMEPHFLFNTLANVQALIDTDAPRARQMLEAFTDYLRASLGTLRRERSTLGAELDLVQTYLSLLKTRMDDRLQFSLDCRDAGARDALLPPLLLQPLVENAIHHGLEPKLEGGHVRVSVQRQGETLVLEVADDGMGLQAPPRRRGNGVALNNLRQRLKAHYGAAASLSLTDATPGTRATLRLPFETASTP